MKICNDDENVVIRKSMIQGKGETEETNSSGLMSFKLVDYGIHLLD